MAGFASLLAGAILKPRLGRKEPLSIKRGGNSKEIVLAHVQKLWVQAQIDEIAKDLPVYREDTEYRIQKVRKLLKRVDSDSFFTMNSEIASFSGTLLMWFSLCQIQSGFSLSVYNQRYQVELAYVNCLVAGGAGGLSALLMKKAFDLKYWSKLKNMGGNAGRIASKTGLAYDQ